MNPGAEAHAFTGSIDKDKRILKIMILALFAHAEKKSESRLRSVVVTMGGDGIFCCELQGTKHVFNFYKAAPFDQSKIKSVVGAGDSFLAGYVYGLLKD